MKVYTRRGDAGETDLLGAGRVPKDHPRVDAYGAVDELNAALGVAAAATTQDDLRTLLTTIQRELFALGAYLATPEERHRAPAGIRAPNDLEVGALEAKIDTFEGELPALQRFVLPGGTAAAAAFHVARTVCRRVERNVVALGRLELLEPTAVRYLNRLSDLLFVMARLENRRAGLPDVEWEGRSG
ncbi:cob(I)yrinic acid a,c-diamide adenosyltransferase [Myxococcota bacterium]|nr:cob(I)yrinic acid a,c-diamide adenosyltransferase [Myxococcota bacterium]MCZ7620444.1 cob(I)yrinic acid a,c-diamide adenosyltransferase [Myxococcota bacterium]